MTSIHVIIVTGIQFNVIISFRNDVMLNVFSCRYFETYGKKGSDEDRIEIKNGLITRIAVIKPFLKIYTLNLKLTTSPSTIT